MHNSEFRIQNQDTLYKTLRYPPVLLYKTLRVACFHEVVRQAQ
ncbi:hypothetical protein [Nostoc sp. DSM 114159]